MSPNSQQNDLNFESALQRTVRFLNKTLDMLADLLAGLDRPWFGKAVVWGLSLFILVSKIWGLNKGLGYADEGYYLFYLRDQQPGWGSMWSLFFKWLPPGVILIRSVGLCIVLLTCLVSALMLKGVFACENKNERQWPLLIGSVPFALMGVAAWEGLVCSIPAYALLNVFFFVLSAYFLFKGIVNQKVVYLLPAGFFAGFIFFAMHTNILCWGAMGLLAFMVMKRWFVSLALFLAGIVLGVCFYFIFIQSPSDYISTVLGVFSDFKAGAGKADSQYGVLGLLKWLFHTGQYAIFNVCVPAVLLYMSIEQENSRYKWLTLLCIGFLFFQSFGLFWLGQEQFPRPDLFLVLVSVMAVISFPLCSKRQVACLLFLALSVVLLSFGTNVPFKVRGGMYFGILLLPLSALFRGRHQAKMLHGALYLGVLLLAFSYARLNFVSNWSAGNLLKATVPVQAGKETLYVSQDMARAAQTLRTLGLQKQICATTDFGLWGLLYLLEVRPVTYKFQPSPHEILHGIGNLSDADVCYVLDVRQEATGKTCLAELRTKYSVELTGTLDYRGGVDVYRVKRLPQSKD